jgi:hypothetical protein
MQSNKRRRTREARSYRSGKTGEQISIRSMALRDLKVLEDQREIIIIAGEADSS